MLKIRNQALVAGFAGIALTLSACASGSIDGGTVAEETEGSSTPEETQSETVELREVSFGIFPSSAVAAMQVAIDEGIFEANGIDLELVVGAGSSAAQLPALTTGELDFMLASPTTPLTASAQGLDVRIITGFISNDPETPTDSVAVVVGAESTIESAADLAGKTVSVNALASIGEIGIREAVALDGGDPNSINFVQLSFPEVAAQLEAGEIDAAMSGNPFIFAVLGAGGRIVSDFVQDTGLAGNELVTIASGDLVDSDPEFVAQFAKAMTEALDFLRDNHDLIRAALPEVLGVEPAAAERTIFSVYNGEVIDETIQKFADLMFKYEIVETEPDVAAIIWRQ